MIALLAHQELTDQQVWTLLADLLYTQVPADDGSPTLAFGSVFAIGPTPDARIPQKLIVPIRHPDDYLGSVWIDTVVGTAAGALLGHLPRLHGERHITFHELLDLERMQPGSRVVVGVPVGDDVGTLRVVYDQPLAAVVQAAP